MTSTTRPATGSTTYHRNGDITIWDCIQQRWVRGNAPSDALFATMSNDELCKVLRHIGRALVRAV